MTGAQRTTNRRESVERFFSEFDAAFAALDGAKIALRYAEPYLACGADGSAQALPDRKAIGSYFDAIVASYQQLGVTTCTHRDLEVSEVGEGHALAAVTWDLRDDHGDAVVTWRQAYVLVGEERLLVRSSIEATAPGD